jgi:hypothetical protein
VSVDQFSVAFLGGHDIKNGEPIPSEVLFLDIDSPINASASHTMEVLPYSFISVLSKKPDQLYFFAKENSTSNSSDIAKELNSNSSLKRENITENDSEKTESKNTTTEETTVKLSEETGVN